MGAGCHDHYVKEESKPGVSQGWPKALSERTELQTKLRALALGLELPPWGTSALLDHLLSLE